MCRYEKNIEKKQERGRKTDKKLLHKVQTRESKKRKTFFFWLLCVQCSSTFYPTR